MNLNDLLYITIVVVSIISLIGSAFIIVLYHKCENLKVFAFKLVYYLTVFDGIRSLFSMIPTHLDLKDHLAMCRIQGFMLQFSSFSGVIWTGVIALLLYLQVISQKINVSLFFRPLLYFTLISSFVTAVIPLVSNDYQYVGGWCWISTNTDRSTIYRYSFFYAEVWGVILFDLFAYFRIIKKIRSQYTVRDSFLDEGRVMVKRLRMYPLILVFCFAPLTVVRILQTLHAECPLWLLLGSTAISNLLGFFNAAIYGINESVKYEFKILVFGKKRNKKDLLRISDSCERSSILSSEFMTESNYSK